ncbi:MAG: GspE/PulE family protein [Pseudomonadales bacterium]|nr:GspE/PulE family protein [Pseudomonadales bacterium]MDP6469522.1 GspE/PulE family protein [Pseudomonadales bacterium]MDP6827363.1 GspE/PulE family protein [Pseudomonadales bacterium]MDP6971186.1 GspE/PulE family protein [Pseudomonadales bacterium]
MADETLLDLPAVLDELVNAGYIGQRQAEDILIAPRTKRELNLHPLEIVADREYENRLQPGAKLDLETLTTWLCKASNQSYLRIDPLNINVNAVTEVMSYAFAQRHNILAVEVTDDEVVIASAQPFMFQWEGMLTQTLRGRRIRRVVSNPADISRYALEFYTMSRSVARAESEGLEFSGVANFEQMLELGQLKSPDANDAHVVNIVDWLLGYAFEQRASDIHIEPRREKGLIRFRIDGILHHVYELPAAVNAAVTSRLKILGRMDVAEKRRPQDGRIKTKSSDGDEVELRLSTLPTAFGEKMVMRIFDPEVLLRSFNELGLTGQDYERWEGMTTASNGIVLVTGPTGSGKTTTLYSSLKQLATSEVNVCTIEDPIEMVEPAFNQMQVQHNIDVSFASGVRALLRQDPDIIMIGEIRDLETAEMAIQAALTGHLVISTLHTNDAPTAITRLIDLGVPAYMIKATVLGVMAQRLIRTLCPHCKQEEAVDPDAWRLLTNPYKAKPPERVFSPAGCLECRDTGYLGRMGIYELLPLTERVHSAIKGDTDIESLRKLAMQDDMRTLRLAGAQKVGAGHTTISEVLRVAPTSQD